MKRCATVSESVCVMHWRRRWCENNQATEARNIQFTKTVLASFPPSFPLWFALWPVWGKDISCEAKSVSLLAALCLSSLQEIQTIVSQTKWLRQNETIEEPKWDFNKKKKERLPVCTANWIEFAVLSAQLWTHLWLVQICTAGHCGLRYLPLLLY